MALDQEQSLITRRGLIRRVGVAGLAAGVGLPFLLNACAPAAPSATSGGSSSGSGSGGSSGSNASTASVYPTFKPITNGPKPDIPAVGPLYEDAYINYPATQVKSVPTPPGKGGTVSMMTIGLQPPPTPKDQNPAWQAVDKALNADVNFDIVSPADYTAKMGTTMAGGDIPDLMFFYAGPTASSGLGAYNGGPQFAQKACADLTPYLASDAAKDYPNLAAIPTQAWKNSGAAYQGKLYLVPLQRFPMGFGLFKNSTIYDAEIGKDYVPKDVDDLTRVMKALVKPQENRYAIGQTSVTYWTSLFGAPNNWRVESDGKFTKAWETPEWKEGLAWMKSMWDAGVFHPQTLENTNITATRSLYAKGNWVLWWDQFGNGWQDFWRQGKTQNFSFGMISPFSAHSNLKPQHFFAGGMLGGTAIKNGTPDRIKELLGILNYLAAPFGSQEDLLLTFGVKDADYTLDANGNPQPTKQGTNDATYTPWKYIMQHPAVIYAPDLPGFAQAQSDAEKQVIPIGVPDPTFGLISQTNMTKGAALTQTVTDATTDIVVGRRPLTDWDQVVKDYFSGGGDQIRQEFQQSYAASK